MRLTLDQAAQAMQAEVCGAVAGQVLDKVLFGAAMDSRLVCPGDLFFCLPGTRVDGHDFAAQALQAGAAAVVANRRLPGVEAFGPILVVADTVRALGELGRTWRRLTSAKVVGVTGSAGKTTVKEMLAQVCSLAGETRKNQLNWNNQVGLPMSLLSCTGQEAFWVMEAGISRPGDMDELGHILTPDLALVTNIGPAHLETLGSVAGVARAKASLLGYLTRDGAALVNQDYEDLWQEAKQRLPSVHGFSTQNPGAEFYGRRVLDDAAGNVRMELVLGGRRLYLQWPKLKAPMLENALAVAGAAALLGIDDQVTTQGLLKACASQGRFQISRHGGWLFIDDTYNANPLSMGAALDRARELAGFAPLVCVLGDMLELGGESMRAHQELGRKLAQAECTAVLFYGHHAQDVLHGLSEAAWTGRFLALDSPQALCDAWKEIRTTQGVALQGVALFKGSRSKAMETFFSALCAKI
jgi:UDP-N-acetylmuramoyl-tripeptide--D-alanyl-D-alanine ligase